VQDLCGASYVVRWWLVPTDSDLWQLESCTLISVLEALRLSIGQRVGLVTIQGQCASASSPSGVVCDLDCCQEHSQQLQQEYVQCISSLQNGLNLVGSSL
jgi:hypothetical protein